MSTEKIAQCDSLASSIIPAPKGPIVKLSQPKFVRANQPTVFLGKHFKVGTVLKIQSADVATFLNLVEFILDDDPKGKPLRSANGRAVLIDATRPIFVKKGTAPDWIGVSAAEQL